MEKRQLWTVIGVALVVAVVASLITGNLTGNAIWSFAKRTSVSYEGVLNMLNKCTHHQSEIGQTCDVRCRIYNKICIHGELGALNESDFGDAFIGQPTIEGSSSCSEANTLRPMSCICCSTV